MTNNISLGSNLQKIKKYVKSSLSSNIDKVLLAQLPQSKSYLKIVGIFFNSEKTNSCILSDEIENVLKNNHLFNNIVLASKSCVIKVTPKSDIAIVWIDIWDTQNGSNAKKFINCQFNISSYIATVCSANMNPRVPQCKNCWKWDHTAEVCRIQETKCVKCNSSHLTGHYHYFAWYCKANDKINPLRLKTKKGKPCPHLFKCLDYKGKHQADSNDCPFWKHYFNKEWHIKEYAKIQNNQRNSTHSAVNGSTI